MYTKNAPKYVTTGILLIGTIAIVVFLLTILKDSSSAPSEDSSASVTPENSAPEEDVGSTLYYTFNVDGTLQEAVRMDRSSSPYFWLNSGGKLIIDDGIGKTIEGRLSSFDRWRLIYNFSNPTDTDGGYLPQNLFRLVTKSSWDNVEASIRLKIVNVNQTDTPNRGGWSGIQLMSRYKDGDNLYYAGIRMDGAAVIKKKYRGTYYTLALDPLFTANGSYNRDTNPNLIPENAWIGLRGITRTNDDGSVTVELWLDRNDSDNWEQVLSVTDVPGRYGEEVIKGAAHTGIRTDYLDLNFDDYTLKEL